MNSLFIEPEPESSTAQAGYTQGTARIDMGGGRGLDNVMLTEIVNFRPISCKLTAPNKFTAVSVPLAQV